MAITNGYTTLATFKSYRDISSTNANDDAVIEAIIMQASRAIDAWCNGRRFYGAIETRYYQPVEYDRVWIDDCMSITTLKTDADGDAVYETTWAGTDYVLAPYNSAVKNRVETAINGTYSFPTGYKAVEIVGRFGYEVAAATGSTLAEDLDASEVGIDVASAAAFQAGNRIRVDSEEMIVDSILTNTLTVRRGQNGTTAATHSSGATVTIAAVPQDIEMACLIVSRDFYLARFGEAVGSGGMITPDGVRILPGGFSRTAIELLRPYRGII